MIFQPYVSVIIPVYNDGFRLRKCLSTLSIQTYSKDYYEILVVDNASSIDDIESICKEFPGVIYLFEGKKGSYAARNRALGLAKGEIIGFTDSDCIPTKDWIESAVRMMSTGTFDILGGQIKVFPQIKDQPNDVELYEQLFAFSQESTVKEKGFTVTANLFTYQDCFKKNGFFDDNLLSGGDAEWCQRGVRRGMKIVYASDVVVFHPARHSYEELKKKVTRIMGGNFRRKKGLILSASMKLKQLLRVTRVLIFSSLSFRNKLRVIRVIFFVQLSGLIEYFHLALGKEADR